MRGAAVAADERIDRGQGADQLLQGARRIRYQLERGDRAFDVEEGCKRENPLDLVQVAQPVDRHREIEALSSCAAVGEARYPAGREQAGETEQARREIRGREDHEIELAP